MSASERFAARPPRIDAPPATPDLEQMMDSNPEQMQHATEQNAEQSRQDLPQEGPEARPKPDASASRAAPERAPADLDPSITREIDEAMAALGFTGEGAGEKPQPQPQREAKRQSEQAPGRGQQPDRKPVHAEQQPPSGAQRAPIRGPRVVQAGREHRRGKVVSVGESDIFIEFGPKELGVAPRPQWKDEPPAAGEEIEVVVERFEPTESLYICSRPGAVQKAAWELLEVGQTVEARVTGTNKGGLELEVGAHRAFMPASQVSLDRVEDLSVFVGEKLTCEVAQVDRSGKGNIVLSRRNMLKAEREELAKSLRDKLKEGDIIDGVVRKLMPFGAFVDLGGVDGLVHVSDLTHERVGHGEKAVERYVQEGQQVRVQILKIDWEKNRISLGMKQLEADPFQAVKDEIVEGADVTGRVTRIAEFGVFVEVATGVEGLVHISEVAHRRVGHPSEEVKEGEVVPVRVLKIDPESRRVSLSIKALKGAPKGAEPRGGRGGGRGRPGEDTRSAEEIMQDTPALRRLREKFGKQGFKGGLS